MLDHLFGPWIGRCGSNRRRPSRSGRRPRRRDRPIAAPEALEARTVLSLAFESAIGFGATQLRVTATALDDQDSAYVLGTFQGTIDLHSGRAADALVSDGGLDLFVAKFGPDGSTTWARRLGGASKSVVQGTALAVDAAGAVYLTGNFTGPADFDPGPGTYPLGEAGRSDIFAAKLHADGSLAWALDVDSAADGASSGSDIAVGPSGEVYLAGSYQGSASFGRQTLLANGQSEGFLARLDTSGRPTWAISTRGSGNTTVDFHALAVDGSGGIAVAGSFAGPVDFDPGPGTTTLPDQGGRDAFVARFDVAGNLLWGRGLGGSDLDQAEAVAIDGSGNLYATGIFSGTVDFDPGPGVAELVGGGIFSTFVVRFDPSGAYGWSRAIVSPNGLAWGTGLAIDPNGAVAIGGYFNQTVDFDPGPGTYLLTGAGAFFDVFVARLDASGGFLEAIRAGGANGDTAVDLAVNGRGRLAIVGGYVGPAAFGPTTLAKVDAQDGYLALLPAPPPAASAAPPPPVLLDPAGADPTLTPSRSPRFQAAPTANGRKVDLIRDGQIIASRVGAGVLIDPGPVKDGVHAYAIREWTEGGVVSPSSDPIAVRVDGTAPTAPTSPSLLDADDTGTLGDGRTAATRPRLAGSTEPGATVQLLNGPGTVLATGSAALDGSFQVQPASPLADGTYVFRVRAIDRAGNVGPASLVALTLTIDATAPAAPPAPSLLEVDDSGVVGDRITSVRRPRFAGTAEPGSLVQLLGPAGTVLGSTVAGSDGAYLVAPDLPMANGVQIVRVSARDEAGNLGVAGEASSFLIDDQAPATPGPPALLAEDDSGIPGDGRTQLRRPRLSGSAEAGTTVQLLDPNGSVLGQATVGTDGAYVVAIASRLNEGTIGLRARAIDAAGNVGEASLAWSLTIDAASGPLLALPSLVAADDSGTLGDRLTSARMPRLTGWAMPGALLRLVDGLGNTIGRATAGADGSYTIQPEAPLPETWNALTVRAEDAEGFRDAPMFALKVDATAPGPPPAPTIQAEDDTGIKGDALTALRRPRLAGTAEPGSVVELLDVSDRVLANVLAAADGVYVLQTSSTLRSGRQIFRVRSRDAAGNQGPAGPGLTLTIAATAGDYDGDGKADVAVYRPTSAQWFIRTSPTTYSSVVFGLPGVDLPVPADYDGDGKADLAVYRPTTGQWFIRGSAAGFIAITYGLPGADLPVPADYDGDGKADLAVYRPGLGRWFIQKSTGGQVVQGFGAPSYDVPVPADYDGDGKADIAVYREVTAQWLILNSTGGMTTRTFGLPRADVPVPADYDGDGKADIAVYRPGAGQWFALRSTDGGVLAASAGPSGAGLAVPGDFDGDGKADFAVYRAAEGLWTGAGVVPIAFGIGNLDLPMTLPTAYRPAYRVKLPGPVLAPLR